MPAHHALALQIGANTRDYGHIRLSSNTRVSAV